MKTELARSKVTAQDQTSVPLEVRKRFGIKAGAELGWYEEGGRLIIDLARPHTLADARAALARAVEPREGGDVKAGIRAHLVGKFRTSRMKSWCMPS